MRSNMRSGLASVMAIGALFSGQTPGVVQDERPKSYKIRGASQRDKNKYTGHDLRQIRLRNGVGRPRWKPIRINRLGEVI